MFIQHFVKNWKIYICILPGYYLLVMKRAIWWQTGDKKQQRLCAKSQYVIIQVDIIINNSFLDRVCHAIAGSLSVAKHQPSPPFKILNIMTLGLGKQSSERRCRSRWHTMGQDCPKCKETPSFSECYRF